MKRKKVNYLNNKDILKEIHKSKISFCDYKDDADTFVDLIVNHLDEIDDQLDVAYKKKVDRLADAIFNAQEKLYIEQCKRNEEISEYKSLYRATKSKLLKKNPSISVDDLNQKIESIIGPEPEELVFPKFLKLKEIKAALTGVFDKEDLVFRVITYEHIPKDLKRKKTKKTVADSHVRLNFIPFKHYRWSEEKKEYYEVLRSHTQNGKFCLTHGAITNKLAKMFMMLNERYSQRGNWRGYSYVDEFKAEALLQFSAMGLLFNEARSDNPFSYYTQLITNSFTRVLNDEKKNQSIRDDLLEQSGQDPSISRQIDNELEIAKIRESVTREED